MEILGKVFSKSPCMHKCWFENSEGHWSSEGQFAGKCVRWPMQFSVRPSFRTYCWVGQRPCHPLRPWLSEVHPGMAHLLPELVARCKIILVSSWIPCFL